VEHPGQVTDLRVVKSLIHYLVHAEGDARRITIAEGGVWDKLGEPGTDPSQKVDGWTVHYPEFDDLSYQQIVEEFNGVNGIRVDIVDLNYDTWVDGNGEDHGHGPPIPVPDPYGTGITGYQRPEGYYVSKTLLECDKLINLPVMKTHYIPGVTLIFKNYVGTFMPRAYGENTNHKGLLHSYAGDKSIPKGFVDLFSYRPTDYALIECFWGTEGDGPVTGDDIKLNLVVAGGDPVATDAVAAAVMGFNPRDIGYFYYAAAKGFGTFDLRSITVVGQQIAEVEHDFVKSMGYKGRGTGFVGRPNPVWLVNGHYKGNDLQTDYLAGEAEVVPREGDIVDGNAWIRLEGNEEGVDLSDQFGAENRVIAYAFTYVYADADMSSKLWIGADDGVKVWLNGEVVLDNKKAGGYTLAKNKVPISLKKGGNRLLVKVWNFYGVYGFVAGIFEEDGDTPLGIEYRLTPPVTAVQEVATSRVPECFALSPNYPNPFNPLTTIAYDLLKVSDVTLTIYTITGQQVAVLVNTHQKAGHHTIRFDGSGFANGVYLYRLEAGGFVETRRMVLLK
jgi:hypothetical protein